MYRWGSDIKLTPLTTAKTEVLWCIIMASPPVDSQPNACRPRCCSICTTSAWPADLRWPRFVDVNACCKYGFYCCFAALCLLRTRSNDVIRPVPTQQRPRNACQSRSVKQLNRLQSVLSAAARLIWYGARKFELPQGSVLFGAWLSWWMASQLALSQINLWIWDCGNGCLM